MTQCADHSVFFYQNDSQIDEAAARFVFEGMSRGDDAVVIATPGRRRALVRWLVHLGLDGFQPDAPQLLMYDARVTLSSFMVDGMPDADLFRSTLAAIFTRTKKSPRAFGEMVDILVQEGQVAAALRLEELWNEEIGARDFPLFCGYALKTFGGPKGNDFDDVCRRHSKVVLEDHTPPSYFLKT